jgi:DNA/RNA-binding protein KIN17
MKKERATMNDEQRERMLISEQIERAAAEVEKDDSSSSTPPREEGLKRDECAEKLVLSFAPKRKPETEASTSAPSGGLKLSGLKPGINPLKRPNVFKAAAPSKGSLLVEESAKTSENNDKKRPAPISMAEKLILEDQERKRRRMDRDNTRS